MYVYPIVETNANQQQSPQTTTNISAISNVKTASEISFAEYLKRNLQQASKPIVTRQMENHIAGILWGYPLMTKNISRSKPELEDNAS